MKSVLFLLLLVPILLLSGCSQPNQTENTYTGNVEKAPQTSPVPEEVNVTEKQIEVDKGINKEVTLPAILFEGQDIDQIISQAMKDGASNVKTNEDGSLTFKMSSSIYNDMMKAMEQSVNNYIEDLKNDESNPSIKDFTYNKSFNELTLVVDKETYGKSFDEMSSQGIVVAALYYQQQSAGISPENKKITINVKDESTNEILNTKVYPDDWKIK